MSTKQFDNVISGWVVHTTHQYARTLNFDRVSQIVADALKSGEPDNDGWYIVNYMAKTKQTQPYRTIKFKVGFTPGNWSEVWDYPNGKHGGLEEFSYENWRKLAEHPRVYKDKNTGMIYEVVKPKGWD